MIMQKCLVSPEENELLKAEIMPTHLVSSTFSQFLIHCRHPQPGLCYGDEYFLKIFLLRTNDINP